MSGEAHRFGIDCDGMKHGVGMVWEIERTRRVAGAKGQGSRHSPSRRRASIASALFVCVAAVVMISSAALVSLGKGSAADDEGAVALRQPLPPYNVQGYVYLSDGVTPVVDCVVNVTNKNTGAWNLTVTDPVYGWYEFDLRLQIGGVTQNDVINVTATKDLDIGWVEGVAAPDTTPTLDMNVVMSGGAVIPEFPMLVLPVVGLAVMFTVVGVRRRRDT